MGAGSARPVVSSSTRSNGGVSSLARRRAMSRRVLSRSPWMVQQTQPDWSSTMSPLTDSMNR